MFIIRLDLSISLKTKKKKSSRLSIRELLERKNSYYLFRTFVEITRRMINSRNLERSRFRNLENLVLANKVYLNLGGIGGFSGTTRMDPWNLIARDPARINLARMSIGVDKSATYSWNTRIHSSSWLE